MTSTYDKSVIYEIRLKHPNNKLDKLYVYVGSTTEANYRQRLYYHKSQTKKSTTSRNVYLYDFIRSHGGWSAFEMKPLELFSCKSRKELTEREFYWIMKMLPNTKFSLNSIVH
jgi:hypothetical protein